MKRPLYLSIALVIAGAQSNLIHAQGEIDKAFSYAVSAGFDFDFRLRYEYAEDSSINKADGITLRSRLGYNTALSQQGFYARIEGENVSALSHVNYTTNETNRGTVCICDPEGSEVNQVFIGLQDWWATDLKLGRQRLMYDNARFVGDVGFRQNNQTYDAFSLVNQSLSGTYISYAYIDRVHRIFGDDAQGDFAHDDIRLGSGARRPAGQLGNHDNKTHLLNIKHKGWDIGTLSAYAYLIDNKDFARFSTDTYGLRLVGMRVHSESLSWLYSAEYAQQSDADDSPVKYTADYILLEGGFTYQNHRLLLRYEQLGEDNGASFITPLGTLHKFQGWADKFVGLTPNVGLQELKLSYTIKLDGFKFRLTYHDFDSDKGSINIGKEYNAEVVRKINSHASVKFRYADYHGQAGASNGAGLAADTRRYWLAFEWRY